MPADSIASGWAGPAFWSLALVGHGALCVEAVNRLHGLGWPRKLVDAATALLAIVTAGVPAAVGWRLLAVPSDPSGWHTFYGWCCLAGLAAVVLMRFALAFDPHRDRRAERGRAETLDLADRLGDAATQQPLTRRLSRLPGNELLRVSFEPLALPCDRLPESLAGLKIAHLTDLHMSGRLAIDYYQAIVERVNAWQPDLVCLTGDLVEHTPQLDWVEPVFGRLRPRVATCFILGNHDEKVDCNELRRRLVGVGTIDVGVAPGPVAVETLPDLTLCGDERPWFGSGPQLAGDEAFTLCLAHTPDRFAWAVRAGLDVVLAGHCHGGQVCFPLLGPLLCPSRHGVRYAAGTFRRGRTVMHAGRGSGSLFPLRYLCPPEVTLVTLTPGEVEPNRSQAAGVPRGGSRASGPNRAQA